MFPSSIAAVAAYKTPYPTLCAFLYPLRTRPQARHYIQSSVKTPIRNRVQKSLQVSLKEQMSKEMPNDLGILPGKSSLNALGP